MDLRPQEGFQEKFAACKADIAIGGGAAGVGKSWSGIFEAGRWSHVPRFNAILFRRTQPEIRGQDGLWDESCKMYSLLGGHPRENTLDWQFKSGARIKFASMQHEHDRFQHQGRGYALVYFDELTHFTERQFWYLLRSMRSMSGVRPYLRATCNPDPDSFVRKLIDWYIGQDGYPLLERAGKLRWFARFGDDLEWSDTKDELLKKWPDCKPKSFTFIPGRIEDNQKLLEKDPDYLSNLDALQYVERMQMRWGNWNVRASAGSFFKRHWFDVVDDPPEDLIRVVRAWDKAATPKTKDNDPAYTAGCKMALTRDKKLVIMHIAREHLSVGGVDNLMKRTAKLDGKSCEVAMWRDPGQAGKVDQFHTSGLMLGYTFRAERAAKDKQTYASPLSAAAEHGRVIVVRGAWNEPFFIESENFPDGKYKDQIDAASLAMLRLTGKRKGGVVRVDPDAGYSPGKNVC